MNVGVLYFITVTVILISRVQSTLVLVEIGRTFGLNFCKPDPDSDPASALQVWVVAELLSDPRCERLRVPGLGGLMYAVTDESCRVSSHTHSLVKRLDLGVPAGPDDQFCGLLATGRV
jgi:hypothetical protein